MVYQFDELSESAKEKARDWWRELIDQNDYDYVIEDAVRVGEILGIEFSTHSVQLYGGGTRQEPNIWWSGFYSQGDGACFEGYYNYKKGALKELKAYAPVDENLHRIVARLQEVQKANFYQLHATVKHTGHYSHSRSTTIEVSRLDYKDVSESAEEEVASCLRDFMDWIYKQLSTENDYLNSDEQLDDAIRANEYEFYENGERV